MFKNEGVAAKYIPATSYNPKVHVPGIYSGKLKDIPLDAAEALVRQGSNLLSLKPTAAAVVTTELKSNDKKNLKPGSTDPSLKGTDK